LETLSLGTTGRSTTRLGFGCSSIMGGLGHRESLTILETAFDAGIRHFDVAPMYGYGEAESCLGVFIRRHAGQITVTTKFGIPPESGGAFASLARSVARPIVRKFPALKQRLSRASASTPDTPAKLPVTQELAPKPVNPLFSVKEARRSLHRSLSALKSDHIDVWLLHEVTAADLHDETLLRFLEESRQAGLIGTFGAGTDRSNIHALVELHPDYCPTLQYEWSIFDPLEVALTAFRIHHRSLSSNFSSVREALLSDKERCSRWSRLIDADLSHPATLAQLMLKAAMLANPESPILFSSKSAAHIKANVALADDDSLSLPALSLFRLVQTELVAQA